MEILLRAALLDWLRADPALAAVNLVAEEAPAAASLPWLGIAASASTDWSAKGVAGREIRIALELHCRGGDPASAATLVRAIGECVEALPRDQPGLAIITTQFLRARAEQRARNTRSVLLEYRFRVLAD
ncbi:DUF3168 domain-containing protein [Altererythrobacter sp. CC-YST694]|uniref:DUF3168 domain-containing protein n=1 Tax=Altererythrobacter sp. CC-YST694 TaxID=2755038 RepID=UPI001D016B72|nr:DUF3168 domain-containing protein [Altererythrobacter sp. CC-YST694]MCB5425227.1 DUF3168 domain-containing protein [Altererythrobacter sp. CC-YST694]